MLQDIDIENFRCFEKTRISGFTRVNLIGGKNNAGKTALLEALLLEHSPKVTTIGQLRQIRKESSEVTEVMSERAWDNLFFKQNKEKDITIVSQNDERENKIIKISYFNSITKINFKEEGSREELLNLIAKSGSPPKSILNIKVILYGKLQNNEFIFSPTAWILNDPKLLAQEQVSIILSFERMSNKNLTAGYGKARLNEKDQEILKAFQLLDPSIQEIESIFLGTGEPTLYLKRTGQKPLPLSLFGDAINRVAEIMITLVNNDDKVLLIDEIENGVHYSNQRDFWRTLFRLSIELDTQIFATTHSLEMIQAFKDVGLAEYPDLGAYFEMTRAAKTNQIIGIKRDLETLEYALEQERPIRG